MLMLSSKIKLSYAVPLPLYGSRTISAEENCPPTSKQTLTQTLTPTRDLFCSGTIFWLPPNPKSDPNLDPNPNPNRGQFSSGGGGGGEELSGYHILEKLS